MLRVRPIVAGLLGIMCLLGAKASEAREPAYYVFYHSQGRKVLPRITLHFQSYLPLIDLLQLIDLPYSESVSAGFVKITVGTNIIKMTKDRAAVQVNDSSLTLPAPLTFENNRWLVPPEFLTRVLNRVLAGKIVSGISGNRFCLGGVRFIRLNARGVSSDQGSQVVIHMNAPAPLEIKKEQSRLIFSFGVSPIDPAKEDFQYQDSLVNSVTFEDSSNNAQLTVQLADKNLKTRVTQIPEQNAYLLDVNRNAEDGMASGEELAPQPSLSTRSQTRSKRWRRVVIDPGHGGNDRGAQIKENLFEKDIALSLARKLRWMIQIRLGVTAVLSRNEDQALSLDDRALAANATQSDIFLSIHVGNWNSSDAARSFAYIANMEKTKFGGERVLEVLESSRIHFLPWTRSQVAHQNNSAQLALLLQTELNQSLNHGDANLSYRRAPLKLLSSLAMPAVLVEIGNASQAEFSNSIQDDQFQNSVAAALFTAIEKFRAVNERP